VSGASFAQENLAGVDDAPARVGILLPLALAGVYDYTVPKDLTLAPGDYVVVPLGQREEIGVVWGSARGDVAAHRLKAVLHRFDAPPMPEAQRRFIDWVADYTMSSAGAVMRMAIPVPEALEPPAALAALRARAGFVAAKPLTASRRKALEILAAQGPMTARDLARAAGVGAGVVKALADLGAAEPAELAVEESVPGEAPDPEAARVALSPQQQAAAAALREAVRVGVYSATLLEGVTGSGKTEVYFEAVAEALRAGRQALVLVPEIALTAQWIERFAKRFGSPPALWHSDVRGRERRLVWRGIAEGRVRAVVGARSALYLPFTDLGLVVVDEEHDSSFKQEDGVVYHARDMAVVRAHLGGFPVVLASATPALETLANVERGRYRKLDLPERHGGATLPEVKLVDLRRAPPPPRRWLSPELAERLGDTLDAGEQAMLFLNRRGYAPVTVCRTCGTKINCPNCSTWLVEHRLAGKLQCHHCGYAAPLPKSCASCGAEASLVGCGPGVERLAEEAALLFPDARLAIMASDTVHGPEAAQDFVRRMKAREIDLVIGTQIVAKGHDFPLLTLVGVVDADLSLGGGDLRAAERTWQLLAQVSGRAGRAERPGRVLLQTYMPEHPVLQALAAGDRERFLAAEMEARRASGTPPYGRLAALVVSAPKREQAERAARDLARAWPGGDGVEMWGPAPAPLALLRGLHRFRLLVKARKDVALQPLIRRWLAAARQPGAVRIKIDIDPYSFL
jgi:primosomal protein N' (replication factor Y)